MMSNLSCAWLLVGFLGAGSALQVHFNTVLDDADVALVLRVVNTRQHALPSP